MLRPFREPSVSLSRILTGTEKESPERLRCSVTSGRLCCSSRAANVVSVCPHVRSFVDQCLQCACGPCRVSPPAPSLCRRRRPKSSWSFSSALRLRQARGGVRPAGVCVGPNRSLSLSRSLAALHLDAVLPSVSL